MQKLYLIDGSSYIYRAFYAIRSLSTSKGQSTNALYGFTRMLLKMMKEVYPNKLAIIFDTKEPTFRDELFEDYKANRKAPPDDLVQQFPYFSEIVDALNVKSYAIPGFEADDIIGTLADHAEKAGMEVVVVTGDKDFMQIVSDHVKLYDSMKEAWTDYPEVKKKFGVKPEQVVDVMALIGDASDNIPGVRGIGPKIAENLIGQFNSLEELFANIDKVTNAKAKNALTEHKENAFLSKKLATIKRDVPLDFDWSDFDPKPVHDEKAKEIFMKLEFFKLLQELTKVEKKAGHSEAGHHESGHPEQSEGSPESNIEEKIEKAQKGEKVYIYDIKRHITPMESVPERAVRNMEDVRLMSYVENPANPADIISLSQSKLGTQSADIDELGKYFEAELQKNEKLYDLYKNVELPLLWVLHRMERKGVKVDSKLLEELSREYEAKIAALEKDIFSEAGEEFTINSPKQLSHILFEKLNVPPVKKTKTGFSTDSSVLTVLAKKFELPKLVLEYRSIAKLKSTYIDVLPTLVDAASGRIHTTFNQTVTATGRLSSSDPNLQNVPARTEEGMRIRSAFIAEKGFKLLSADYSQIELRILAHISGEEALITAFSNGQDVHSDTASKIFGVPLESVDSKMRGVAKTVNFGVLYGQSAYGLAEQLQIHAGEADQYIKNYYKTYPKVSELKEKILKDAEKNGFVETLFGRRRYIPDILSSNKGVKGFAERTAFNAVFQGTAADIIKIAMIEIDKLMPYMTLQVHDELVLEIPEGKLEEVSKIVREKMCEVVKLEVPLEVEIGIGSNWAEC